MRLLFVLGLFFTLSANAGDSTKLYHPFANAAKDIEQAVNKAKKENKHVLLQIGGNWCTWCYKFNSFVLLDSGLKKLLNDNFIVYHLNYSKENRNLASLKKLGNPQRFGFPVLVVLDEEGEQIYTQATGLLAKGNGYDRDKIRIFLSNFSPAFDQMKHKE